MAILTDLYNTVTGENRHAGSWLGLPELGVTESIGASRGIAENPGTGGVGLANLIAGVSNQPSQGSTQNQSTQRQSTLPQSNVLGLSTQTGGGTQTTNPQQQQGGAGSYPRDQYVGWDPAAAQADWEAKNRAGTAGGGQQQTIESLISEMYGPALAALSQIESGLGQSKESSLMDVGKEYESGQGTIERERGELEQALTGQSQQLEKSGQSAFAEATRNLNSLFQTLASRYGSGSGTGRYASEIVSQEFLRNQGKMREQLEQGRQSIAAETTKMKNYVTDKITQLDSWKRDAISKINENYQNKMAEIAMRRGDVEANKTRDRIALLQDSVNRAREVESREMDFKNGLAQFAVETMQSVSNRSFTPQEIAQVVNEMLGQNISGFTQATSPGGLSLYNPSQLKSREDELRNLNPLS